MPTMKASLALALVALAATTAGATAQQPRRPPPETADQAKADKAECVPQGELPKAWQGQAFAIDGTTLAGIGLKPHLRLWGIQTAELRDKQTGQETVPGMRARAALADLLAKSDHKLKCRPIKFDRTCHLVAQCSLDDAQAGDLGGGLIAAGMAYGFLLDDLPAWEPRAGQRYADAEFEARKAKRGLWPMWLGEK
jgi:endonuclease YncB( thermonuclease family)